MIVLYRKLIVEGPRGVGDMDVSLGVRDIAKPSSGDGRHGCSLTPADLPLTASILVGRKIPDHSKVSPSSTPQ